MSHHGLRSALIFIAVVGICVFGILFAIDQFRPHPDFEAAETKMLTAYNNFSKTYDTSKNPWFEITFIKDNQVTILVHTSPDKDMTFHHIYKMWKVTDNSTGNGKKVKLITDMQDYNQKTFWIKAGETAEVTFDCTPITTLELGGRYVLETNDMLLYFEVTEPVNDKNFIQNLFNFGGDE